MKKPLKKLPFVLITLTVALFFFFAVVVPIWAADTTAPGTTHEFQGTIGNHDWYTSTVDVTLTASDIESGPASSTYWLDSQDPTIYEYQTSENQVLNPSFENGYLLTVYNWDHNSGWALFWRTFLEHKFGWRAAATAILGDGTYFWHDRNYAVAVTPGQTYTASAWIKTVELWGGTGAWFEVWAKGSGSMDTDTKLCESYERIVGETDWQMLTRTFTVPSGSNQIYLRLYTQDTGFIGLSFWDGISIHGGYEASFNFTIVENGNHTFHYYSTDNVGNNEAIHNVPLKIDTIAPQDWRNFDQQQSGNDHTYVAMIEVRDITSGIDTATAQYAYYTDHQNQEWDHNGDGEKDWYSVSSVTRVDNGQNAADGYTGFVKLTTPAIDFGDSATIMKVQFRILDMAGNLSNSPVQTIFGPWIQITGQPDLYAAGGIEMGALPPSGVYNTDSLVIVGNATQINFVSEKPWILTNYSLGAKTTLADFIDKYDLVREQAQPLPNNKLPDHDGIFYYTGNYTIDQNSISQGFKDNVFSTIIIIEGDATIKKDFTIQPDSIALFLITGSVGIWGNVGTISGYFITQGDFNTNINSQGTTPLQIKGSVASCQRIILARDLGRKGAVSNVNTPAEKFIFQPQYLLSDFLTRYLGGGDIEIDWKEVSP